MSWVHWVLKMWCSLVYLRIFTPTHHLEKKWGLFLGRARRSRGGLMESCLHRCHRARPPSTLTTITPAGLTPTPLLRDGWGRSAFTLTKRTRQICFLDSWSSPQGEYRSCVSSTLHICARSNQSEWRKESGGRNFPVIFQSFIRHPYLGTNTFLCTWLETRQGLCPNPSQNMAQASLQMWRPPPPNCCVIPFLWWRASLATQLWFLHSCVCCWFESCCPIVCGMLWKNCFECFVLSSLGILLYSV